MICLGIDTSSLIVRVAVTRDHQVLADVSGEGPRTHSETLLAAVQESLDTAGVSLSAVDLIAVGRGPGAWTGLRVGIATAKSLAYALSIPIVGISTLEAVAAGVTGFAGKLAVIVDARRGEVCGASFDVDGRGGIEPEGGVFLSAPEGLDRFVGGDRALVGNGVVLLAEKDRANRYILPEVLGQVDAAVICRLAEKRYRREGPDSLSDVVPIYVRKSDAEVAQEKKEGGR
jgi:tRNA threonylcarbamoyladenosine biosynthesis protein TsaB